jgi:hypothetical protein
MAATLVVGCGGFGGPMRAAAPGPVVPPLATTPTSAAGTLITPELLGAARNACGEPNVVPAAIALDFAVEAKRFGLTLGGAQNLHFARSGDSYRMTGTMRAAAGLYNLDATSNGQLADGVLRPADYVEKRAGRDPQHTTLDWSAQLARFNGADAAPTQPRMQDRLTLQLQLGWLLRREPGGRRATRQRLPLRATRCRDAAAGGRHVGVGAAGANRSGR